MINKEHILGVVLMFCITIGAATAGDYKSTFSVVSVSENKVQSEACVEATLKNMAIADIEFGSANYMLVTSDKKLTSSDKQTFICEVNILWGVPGKSTPRPLSLLTNPTENSPAANIEDNSGSLTLALGQSIAFELPKGYKSLTGQYLSGTYTAQNDIGYRLIFHRNTIDYKFEENGQSKATKHFGSIGIGIEKPIIKNPKLELLVRLDIVEPFPFEQTLTVSHDDASIEEKVKGSSYISIGLPLKYHWNDYSFSMQLNRLIYSDEKNQHPYNFGVDIGYRW